MSPEARNPREVPRTDDVVARVIVGDTIYTAHTNPEMAGDETVQQCLDLLHQPVGEIITQDMLSQYMGSMTAMRYFGTAPEVDRRLMKQVHHVTALGLRQEMVGQLGRYLGLPDAERAAFKDRVVREREEMKRQGSPRRRNF